ncbi:MAG: rod shape-determining protein MreD [Anaerolineae bacterium]|nr:rod shape-determining protein MreD [Anaerolineae bacterium]
MIRYFGLPLLILAAVLQVTVVPEFRIADGGPDLVLMMGVSWILLAGMDEGLIWTIFGGLLLDVLQGTPMGTAALALVVAVSLPAVALGQLGRGSALLPALAAVSATGIYHLVLMVLYIVIGAPADIGYTLLYVTLPTAIFNAVLIIPVYRLLGVVYSATRPPGVTG